MDVVEKSLIMLHVLRVKNAAIWGRVNPCRPQATVAHLEATADVAPISATHHALLAKLAVFGAGVKGLCLPPHIKAQRRIVLSFRPQVTLFPQLPHLELTADVV
jgi:hypothetical protein